VVVQVVKEIIREDAVVYLQSVFTPRTLYDDHCFRVSISYWTDSGKRIIENPGVRAVSSRRQVRSLPRFKNSADILKLVTNKDQIRNIGIIAHADHGNTTLTDSHLPGAG